MLSSTYLTNTSYNNLPMIEKQKLPDEATLCGLGKLIVDFGVERLVGVYLIHKHFDLTQDTIMVHDGLVCKPQPCSTELSLTGVAYMWDGDKFQAFEYGNQEHLSLADGFLRAFASYLETHKLSDRIALSKADASNKFFMEYCQPTTKSQICEEVNGNEILPGEATEWMFELASVLRRSSHPLYTLLGKSHTNLGKAQSISELRFGSLQVGNPRISPERV